MDNFGEKFGHEWEVDSSGPRKQEGALMKDGQQASGSISIKEENLVRPPQIGLRQVWWVQSR